MSLKPTKEDAARALADLKKAFPPGSRVFIRLDHRSASGMYRTYNVYGIGKDSEGRPDLYRYTWHVAAVCGLRYDRRHEGIGLGGCGFSGEHEIASSLSYALHGNKNKGDGAKPENQGRPFDSRRGHYRAGYTLIVREF